MRAMIIKSKTEWSALFREGIIYDGMVKAAADVEQGLLAVEAEWHSELVSELFENAGSHFDVTWGFNLYPDRTIEYNSLMNVKPNINHKDTDIYDEDLQTKIREVVDSWLI